jgi:hypothetical protein
MIRSRPTRLVPALVGLALFTAWLAADVAHHHASNPSCQLCKIKSGGTADLSRPAETSAPSRTGERVLLATTAAPSERLTAVPLGRAPPLA